QRPAVDAVLAPQRGQRDLAERLAREEALLAELLDGLGVADRLVVDDLVRGRIEALAAEPHRPGGRLRLRDVVLPLLNREARRLRLAGGPDDLASRGHGVAGQQLEPLPERVAVLIGAVAERPRRRSRELRRVPRVRLVDLDLCGCRLAGDGVDAAEPLEVLR